MEWIHSGIQSWVDNPDRWWLLVGFGGQLVFGARFLVQWLVSERKRESVIPLPFWYLSLGGGTILFFYALHIRDPVFIMGQGTGLFIYTRNLVLISRRRRQGISDNTGTA